ncbi:hypothetical protein [Lonepinella koalarum]|uniref:Uncharacterized protein n=1 Tax=Lonepinella koalarum TaxID=53417 RepID=A0A4R1KJK4_9PAST|nr:hypothetical protein [Lonepinella koalarum]MDH2927326.1 hypothetical protein [Lonepinella koalarum]TCK64945.1 hypothetical protein EV692_2430 [Lonepinella koalarum]TFJ88800.1 hypothetical protein E0709_11755 [Lonepinella koalarum]
MKISTLSLFDTAELKGKPLALMNTQTLLSEIQILKDEFPLSFANTESKPSLASFRKGYVDLINLLPAVLVPKTIDHSQNLFGFSSGFLSVLHYKLDELTKALVKLDETQLLLPISCQDRIAFLLRFDRVPIVEISAVQFCKI